MSRHTYLITPISTLLALSLLHAAPAAGQGPPCNGDWEVMTTPTDPDLGPFEGVAVIAPDDVWAVGRQSGFDLTMAMHWDGSAWTVVSTPDPSPWSNTLEAVDAVSSDDVWAAGSALLPLGPNYVLQMLVVHWDGSSWQLMDTPVGGAALIYAIEVVGPNDVWFGGEWNGALLAMHWDGSTFNVLPTPNTPSGNGRAIQAMSARASDDVWAVGGGGLGDESGSSQIIHWDGATWTYVPGPSPLGTSQQLNGVAALAPDDVWAVGTITPVANGPFVLHWDGATWSQVPLPLFAYPFANFQGIVALAPDDIWAAGIYTEQPPPDVGLPLTMHYDGIDWVQTLPDPGNWAWLRGIAAAGPCDLFAVGSFGGYPHAQRYEAGGFGDVYCDTNPDNAADIAIDTNKCPTGSVNVSMSGASPNQVAYLLIGDGNATVTNPPGALGDLCLIGGSGIGRYDKDVGSTGGAGTMSTDVLNAVSGGGGGNIPNIGGNLCSPSGQTWNFQYWHRDGMNPSKFSKAISVTFTD